MSPTSLFPDEPLSIAIIGTAGRGTDAARLTKEVYAQMQNLAYQTVMEISQGKSVHLVSGGAAYADHLAVDLYITGKCDSLALHLPCAWDLEGFQFIDTGVFDWKTNPGGTSNHFHRAFSAKTNKSSLLDIARAIAKGAKVVVGSGFHDRNTAVSKATAVIAFTYGVGPLLKDGGTADTMKKYLKNHVDADLSYHVDLNTMQVHKGAKV